MWLKCTACGRETRGFEGNSSRNAGLLSTAERPLTIGRAPGGAPPKDSRSLANPHLPHPAAPLRMSRVALGRCESHCRRC